MDLESFIISFCTLVELDMALSSCGLVDLEEGRRGCTFKLCGGGGVVVGFL